MPLHAMHCRRTCRKAARLRTSSQSSVEIQVTDNEALITTSAPTTVMSSRDTAYTAASQNMVKAHSAFLSLLRMVGAEGARTVDGELFTIKQLCYYLKEYIKMRRLFDPYDPRSVYCKDDPLGQVFGVEEFTHDEALHLIRDQTELVKNLSPVKKRGAFLHGGQNPGKTVHYWLQHSQPPLDRVQDSTGKTLDQSEADLPESLTAAVRVSCCDEGLDQEPPQVSSTVITPKSKLDDEHPPRTCFREATSEPEDGEKESPPCFSEAKASARCSDEKFSSKSRRRQSSFSILYSSDGEGNGQRSKWALEVDFGAESDESVLSIQSKETVYVQESSDDLWFMDGEDDDEDEDEDDIVPVMSVEFQSSHSNPYSEEYEVQSNSSEAVDDLSRDYDSESPEEHIQVVISDEDEMEFWADSEWSDVEPDSDEDLTEKDKWLCEECDTLNSPCHRYCDRCWGVRPGWVQPPAKSPGEALGASARSPQLTASQTHVRELFGSAAESRKRARSADVKDTVPGANSSSAEQSPRKRNCRRTASGMLSQHLGGDLPSTSCADTKSLFLPHSEVPASQECPRADCSTGMTRTDRPPQRDTVLDGNGLESRDDASADGGLGSSSSCDSCSDSCATVDLDKADNKSTVASSSSCSKTRLNSLHRTRTIDLQADNVPLSVARHVFSPKASTNSPSRSDTLPVDALPRNFQSSDARRNLFQFPQKLETEDSGISLGNSFTSSQESTTSLPRASSGPSPKRKPTLLLQSRDEAIKSATSGTIFGAGSTLWPAGTLNPIANSEEPPKTPIKISPTGTEYSDSCMICLSKPKEASIIHGKTGHQVCCYVCAKALRRRGKPCPLCRRPIQKVVKNYVI